MNLGKTLLLAAVLITAPFAATMAGAQDRRDTAAAQQPNLPPNRDRMDQRSDRDRMDRDRMDRSDRDRHYGWRRGHHYGWYRHHHCIVRWHHHHRVRICR